MSDITDAKNAKVALRESEEQFPRTLRKRQYRHVPITTLDGRILMVNPALIRMLGYGSFAELAERNLQQGGLQPDYAPPRVPPPDRTLPATSSGWKPIHARKTPKNGHIFGRDQPPCRAPKGSRCVSRNDHDISERKQIEETLSESENRYRNHFENSSEFYFTLDLKAISLM